MPKNDWNEYKKLFLNEMLESKEFRKSVMETLNSLTNDVGNLKVKAAMVGGVAGIVGTGLVTMILTAFKHI